MDWFDWHEETPPRCFNCNFYLAVNVEGRNQITCRLGCANFPHAGTACHEFDDDIYDDAQ